MSKITKISQLLVLLLSLTEVAFALNIGDLVTDIEKMNVIGDFQQNKMPLTFNDGSAARVLKGKKMTISDGASLIIKKNSLLYIEEGGTVVVDADASIILEDGGIIWNDGILRCNGKSEIYGVLLGKGIIENHGDMRYGKDGSFMSRKDSDREL